MAHDVPEEIDAALLRKLFLGFVAHELKTRTIPQLKRAFLSAIGDAKIERTAKLNSFVSHLIHDASGIRIEADDKDDDREKVAADLARLIGRSNPLPK